MKLKRYVVLLLTIVALSGLLTACAQKPETQGQEPAQKNEAVGKVSLENPIYMDKANKSVTVLGEVNGKYFTEPTRHFMVYYDGKFGDKSIIKGLGDQFTFYDDLIELGGKAGENMNAENAETTHVQGDKINVSITWNGADKEYDINDVVIDSNNKPIVMRFGGNLPVATAKQTGCISCLDSCYVGIVSNEAYSYGAVEKRKEVEFRGNKDVLPEDGTLVAVTYTLAGE